MAIGTDGTKSPALQIVATPEAKGPSDEQLLEVAKTLDSRATSDLFKVKGFRDTMLAIYNQKETEKRATAEAEAQRLREEQANAIMKMANAVLHPNLPPKQPVKTLSILEIAALAPKRPPTLEERLEELKAKYGNKFPDCVFYPNTHHYASGVAGALIGVKRQFLGDMNKAKPEDKTLLKNKCDILQRAIDKLKEIIKIGYGLDPNDKQNFCPPNIYKAEILPLLAKDSRLIELCKVIETEEMRKQREQQKAEAEKLRLQKEAERVEMSVDIATMMLKVDYFQKLGLKNTQFIAKRVANRFEGDPDTRLREAAKEKCGGNISDDNRQLGMALAEAGLMTNEKIKAMFPSKKGKQEKKNKK